MRKPTPNIEDDGRRIFSRREGAEALESNCKIEKRAQQEHRNTGQNN